MSKKTLRKSEIKELNEKIKEFSVELSKKDSVEVLDKKIILVNDKQWFFYCENKILPALKLVLEKPDVLKKITVDMGAIKFVTSGADIMRPGIVDIDDNINEDEIIVIIDENNKKPLSIGKALFGASEMKAMNSGKVIKNLHFVGDDIWNIK